MSSQQHTGSGKGGRSLTRRRFLATAAGAVALGRGGIALARRLRPIRAGRPPSARPDFGPGGAPDDPAARPPIWIGHI